MRAASAAFEGEPWDSDDSSYVPSDSETPRAGPDMLLEDRVEAEQQNTVEDQPRPPQVSTLSLPAAKTSAPEISAGKRSQNVDSKSGADSKEMRGPIMGQALAAAKAQEEHLTNRPCQISFHCFTTNL